MPGIKDWPKDVKGSSSKPPRKMVMAAFALVGVPMVIAVGVVGALLHGYGVL